MTMETSLNPSEKEFLFQLYQETGGDKNRQVDSTVIGTAIGMDKSSARKISEELIGHGFAAVKTLSGGIGITNEGLAEAQRLGIAPQDSQPLLSQKPIIDADGCKAMEKRLADLKTAISQNRLDYAAMEDLVIDIKTIEVQLFSSKPKTAIIKACLMSILKVLKQKGTAEGVTIINGLIGPSE